MTAKQMRAVLVAIVGAIVLGLWVMARMGVMTGSETRAMTAAPVSLRVSSAGLVVTAKEGREITPGEMTVYVNGTPPGGYTASARWPADGESETIPWGRFVERSGRRFDFATHAPREVWIGGGGYDFALFDTR